MKKSNRYFLPIKVDNLALYLSSAAFAPANFYENRTRDVQSLFENCILLSFSHLVGDADCSVALILTDEECKRLEKLDNENTCFLYEGFLPASRLENVCFLSKEDEEHNRTAINLNSAVLPEVLCSYGEMERSSYMPISQNTKDNSKLNIEYSRYQRVLGGLALMRIVNEGKYTYNLDYLPFLAVYNNQIKYALAAQQIEANSQQYRSKDIMLCIRQADAESSTTKKVACYKNAIDASANQLGLKVRTNPIKHTYEYTSLDGDALILAYLLDYKVNDSDAGGRIMIDSLITNRFANVHLASQVAYYYGYSRGYSKFNKSYESVQYKYDFSNRLDSYAIETVFQLANNKYPTNQFDYIECLFPPAVQHVPLSDGEYLVLGQKIVGKKKPKIGSQEWFDQFYQSLQTGSNNLFETIEKSIAPVLYSSIFSSVKSLVQKSIIATLEVIKNQYNSEIVELTQAHKKEIENLKQQHRDELDKKSQECSEEISKNNSEISLLLSDFDKTLFEQIDKDGDGVLSFEELYEFAGKLKAAYYNTKDSKPTKSKSKTARSKVAKQKTIIEDSISAKDNIFTEHVGVKDVTEGEEGKKEFEANKNIENVNEAYEMKGLEAKTKLIEPQLFESDVDNTGSATKE